MSRGKPGVDSNGPATSIDGGVTLLQRAQQLFGEPPVFWGRYFKAPHNSDTEQYQKSENHLFRELGIRVLPLARQTSHVARSSASLGRSDAVDNVDALFEAFTIEHLAAGGGRFYMFLDTESRPKPPLAREYYTGWASELVQHSSEATGNAVTILPCIYVNQGDNETCRALGEAVANDGVQCLGAAVARYFEFDHTGCHLPVDWDEEREQPSVRLPCPILIWQYIGDCFQTGLLDGNQVNPAVDLQNDLLQFLILPP